MPEYYSQIGAAIGAAMAHNARLAADAVQAVPGDRLTASTITDDQLEALHTDLDRARAERGTYRAAWHSARDRARKHRAAVDDMWDANTRLAQRARRAEKQLADERAEHLRAHEQETANTAAEITRAQRAEQQAAAVRALHQPADRAGETVCAHCTGTTTPGLARRLVTWPCPTAAAIDQPDGQRFELPTVIHRTPEQLRQQRAQLIASTGMTEDQLREAAADYQLTTEHQLIWNTVEGIDYLLDQPDDPNGEQP